MTRSRVAAATPPRPFTTLLTVGTETPAIRATTAIVGPERTVSTICPTSARPQYVWSSLDESG